MSLRNHKSRKILNKSRNNEANKSIPHRVILFFLLSHFLAACHGLWKFQGNGGKDCLLLLLFCFLVMLHFESVVVSVKLSFSSRKLPVHLYESAHGSWPINRCSLLFLCCFVLRVLTLYYFQYHSDRSRSPRVFQPNSSSSCHQRD